MMIMFTAAAFLIGATLGFRFKVLILVPAIAIGSAATLGAGMANDNGAWPILLALVLVITALQIGYFGGVLIRSVSAEPGARKDSPGMAAAVQRSAR